MGEPSSHHITMASLKQAFPKALHELRFHFCQISPASQGLRNFILNNYTQMKAANPSVSLLVRECADVEPKVWARYDLGKESSVSLSGKDEKAVMAELEKLIKA